MLLNFWLKIHMGQKFGAGIRELTNVLSPIILKILHTTTSITLSIENYNLSLFSNVRHPVLNFPKGFEA